MTSAAMEEAGSSSIGSPRVTSTDTEAASPTYYTILRSPLLPFLVFVVLAVSSMARKSATYDEPLLLASGAHYLRTCDVSINAENPPLLKAFCALPTLFVKGFGENAPVSEELRFSYNMAVEFRYGNDVLYGYPRHRVVLFACRCMAVVIGILLGLAVFCAARRIWSGPVALGVLWVYALSPNVLAHSRLTTVDLGCAFFVFTTTMLLHLVLTRPCRRHGLWFGASLGCALLSKFTAVMLLPLLGVQLIVTAILYRPRTWRQIAVFLLEGGLAALLLLNLAYRFEGCGTNLATIDCRSPLVTRLKSLPAVSHIPLPVPEAYVRGFDIVANNNRPGFPNIFLGKLYPDGGSWWYYYLVAVALKSPIPLLFLIGLSAFARRSLGRAASKPVLCLGVVPVLLFFNFSVVAYRQLGFRYILPVWPFVLLFCGIGIDWLARRWHSHPAFRRIALAGVAWYALGTFLIYPDFLGYFNEIAGGAKHGWRYLAASNIDWGQDLYELRRWHRHAGSLPLSVLYCGSAPVAAHGIQSVPFGTLPPAPYLAISVTNYYLLGDVPLIAYLRDHVEPIARAGASIHIYAINDAVLDEFRRRMQ